MKYRELLACLFVLGMLLSACGPKETAAPTPITVKATVTPTPTVGVAVATRAPAATQARDLDPAATPEPASTQAPRESTQGCG